MINNKPFKITTPKAYREAASKPAPRRGLVVTMSIEAFHYYRLMHQVDVLGWNGGVLMVRKTTPKVEDSHVKRQ